MQEYIDFMGKNPLPFIGLIALTAIIVKLEISRFTRKFKQVSVNEAVAIMNKDKAMILDVREDKERTDGTIENAQHIPYSQLSDKMAQLGANKQANILVYCRTGARSNPACNLISKAGYENVSSMNGGIIAWETANLPTVKI